MIDLDGFRFDFGGADLDFDIGDFDVIGSDAGFSFDDRPNNVRYWKPRVDAREVLRKGNFRFAKDFARSVDLSPYAKNPRKNDKAVGAVANSIKEFGFLVPMVIDRNFEIVCGHTRYKATVKLDMKEVPCVIAEELTPTQIKAFRLADNKVSELAGWDFGLLQDLLDELGAEIDMGDFGFSALADFNVDDMFVEKSEIENADSVADTSEESVKPHEPMTMRKITCPCCGKEFEIEI